MTTPCLNAIARVIRGTAGHGPHEKLCCFADGCDNRRSPAESLCPACLLAAAAACDAAGRLPVSRDGVLIVPGMTLWTNDTMSRFPQECKMPGMAIGGDINGGHGMSHYDPTACYSTREAAAKEPTDGQA